MPATRKIMGIGRNAVTNIINTSSALADLTDVNFSGIAQGDIIYYNGSKWANLGHGTTNQVLTTQGSGANPSWTNKTSATGIVGGLDKMVQFNDGGSNFGGTPNFLYFKDTANLTISGSAGYSVSMYASGSSQTASGIDIWDYDKVQHLQIGYNNLANESYFWATQTSNNIKIGTNNIKRMQINASDGKIFTTNDFHVSGTLTAATTTLVATDTIWNAKGDLAVGTASDTAQRLSVGSDNKVLTADSSTTTGLVWKTPEASVDTMSLHIPVGSGNSGGNATRFVSGPFRVDPVGGPYASGNVIMRDTHNGIDNTTGMGRLSLITETGSVPLWVGASGTNATVARFGTISNHTGTIEFIQSHKDTPISSIVLTSGTTTVGAVGSDHIYRINAKGLNFENDELSAADVGSGLKVWASSSNGLYWRDGLLVNAKAGLTNGYLPYVTGAALGGIANSSVYHDSTGKVGINTNSPNRQLDVRGTTLLSGNLGVTGTTEISSTLTVKSDITGTGTATLSTGALDNIKLDPSTGTSYIQLQDTSRTSAISALRQPELLLRQNQIDTGTHKANFPTIRWQKPGPIAADASYTNLGYRIYVSGETGAGTVNAPQAFIWDYNADVADPANYTELMRLGSDGALKINKAYTMPTAAPAGNGYVITGATDGTTAWVANTGGGGGSNYWSLVGNDIFYTSGNVGINADHPSQKLHVSGNVLFGTQAGVGASGYDHIYIGDTTKSIAGYGNRLDFYVTSNPRAHIDSSTFFSATSGGPSLDLTPGPAGTANYGFVGDTDTGMTRSAADTLHLLTAGVSGMTMDSSQRVGIGTTDPNQKLDVRGNIQTSGTIYLSGSNLGGSIGRADTNEVNISAGTTEQIRLGVSNSYLKGTNWVFNGGGYFRVNGTKQLQFGDDEHYIYSDGTDLHIKTTTTASQDIALTSTGKLVVDAGDDINLDAHSSVFNFKRQGSEMLRLTCGASSPIAFQPKQDAYDIAFNQYDGTEVMRITDNARVGIGTTSPHAKLEVSGQTTAPAEILMHVTSGTRSMFQVSGHRIGFGPTGTNAGAMVHIDNTHNGSGYALRTLGGGIDIAGAQALSWGSGDQRIYSTMGGGVRSMEMSIYDFSGEWYAMTIQGGTGSTAHHRVGINTRSPSSGSNNAILDVSGSQRLYGSLELVNGAVTESDDTTNSMWASGTTLMWNDKEVYTNTPGTSEITGDGAANYISYFSAASTITGTSGFQYNGTKVDIAQTADDSALEIAGYDDKSGVTAKMHVAANGMAQFVGSSHTQVKATTDSVYISANEHLYLDNGTRNTYSTIFRDGTGEYARFKNAQLGIGLPNPGSRLHVSGGASFNNTEGIRLGGDNHYSSIFINNDSAGLTIDTPHTFKLDANRHIEIDAGGVTRDIRFMYAGTEYGAFTTQQSNTLFTLETPAAASKGILISGAAGDIILANGVNINPKSTDEVHTRQSEGLVISGTKIQDDGRDASNTTVTSLSVPLMGSGAYFLASIGNMGESAGANRGTGFEPAYLTVGPTQGVAPKQNFMAGGRAVSLVLAGTSGYHNEENPWGYGNFGSLLFHGTSGWTGGARRWLVSNAWHNSGAGDMGLGFASAANSAAIDPTISGSTPSVVMSCDTNYGGNEGVGGLLVGNTTHIAGGKFTVKSTPPTSSGSGNWPQMTLAYDGSNYSTFNVTSDGILSISGATAVTVPPFQVLPGGGVHIDRYTRLMRNTSTNGLYVTDSSGNPVKVATASGTNGGFTPNNYIAGSNGIKSTIYRDNSRMRYDSPDAHHFVGDVLVSGNVGINTAPDASKPFVIRTGGSRDFKFFDYDMTYESSLGIRAKNNGYLGLVTEGTNSVFISTNGFANKRLVVDSAGDVGIGTVGPNAKLDVRGTTILGGNTTVSGSMAITGSTLTFAREDTDSAIYGPNIHIDRRRTGGNVSTGDLIGNINFRPYYGDYDNFAATISANVEGTLGTDTTPGRLVFKTTAAGANTVTERMRIDSAGNVGIGQDGPNTTLDVKGTTTLGGNVTVSGTISATAKSFDIPHPDKKGMRLIHGSLEGPEHGVYVRGTAKGHGETTIELPDYWETLVGDDYTLQLTSYNSSNVYIIDKDKTSFTIGSNSLNYKFDYFVIGRREEIEVEIDG